MSRINFRKLRDIINDPRSSTELVKDSRRSYPEYNTLVSNYIMKHNSFKEKESALHIMSMQNWIHKKDLSRLERNVGIGEIWYADLGSNYKPEAGYNHPVVILEKIGSLYLIVPCTTTVSTLEDAYHPDSNPQGSRYYFKCSKKEGFDRDTAVILSNLRVISGARLIDKKGKMKEINNPDSSFYKIKEKCLELCFPKQYIKFLKMKETIGELKENKKLLEKEIEKLEESNKS